MFSNWKSIRAVLRPRWDCRIGLRSIARRAIATVAWSMEELSAVRCRTARTALERCAPVRACEDGSFGHQPADGHLAGDELGNLRCDDALEARRLDRFRL